MARKVKYGISVDPVIWAAAKEQAKRLHMSTTAYIEQLIRNDQIGGGVEFKVQRGPHNPQRR